MGDAQGFFYHLLEIFIEPNGFWSKSCYSLKKFHSSIPLAVVEEIPQIEDHLFLDLKKYEQLKACEAYHSSINQF